MLGNAAPAFSCNSAGTLDMLDIALVYLIHSVHSLFKMADLALILSILVVHSLFTIEVRFCVFFFNTFIFTFILIYIYISDIVSPFSGSVTAMLYFKNLSDQSYHPDSCS